jgi:hypothetical protein
MCRSRDAFKWRADGRMILPRADFMGRGRRRLRSSASADSIKVASLCDDHVIASRK